MASQTCLVGAHLVDVSSSACTNSSGIAVPSESGNGKENQPPGSPTASEFSPSDLETPNNRPVPPPRGRKCGAEEAGYNWNPFQKQLRTDPLVGHGRHFGRTVRTFCRVQTLISNGLSTTMHLELERITEAELSRRLEERLNTSSEQDMLYVGSMIMKGIGSARSDDTKSLKSAVVDWITPPNQYLNPPLQRNAYKHVFTSPSSVYATNNGASKATRSSNARIHGMTQVTIPSIAYIATQVRFALSSSTTFSRTDLVTDSEFFYDLIIDLLEDPDEEIEVAQLLRWWNQQIFPVQVKDSRSVHGDSVIAKIKERRALINRGAWPPPRSMPPRLSGRRGLCQDAQDSEARSEDSQPAILEEEVDPTNLVNPRRIESD
ncbi:hypothetical protein FA13DRAFT_1791985 [Coprinellus micaceus]|uniref:Uncharacterized protein n=1 Tax=Coprinellus micaceus TaxID=71717 RepID=A0A4Y7TB64_COPMI|nr:hypothetical protein FA13DRAFT_1791985 [Coprinellus micaceus]